ncbi:MliC family protein, partial [Candidatus Kaiserbacteria bacterium]|nr:MliC family protein [Candidatus Kaiserbacteria bacterium]
MKGLVWVVVLIVILIGGYFVMQQSNAPVAEDLGTYAYTCDNGSQFTMSPSADVTSIKLSAGSQGMFTGDVTLQQKESTAGARYEGSAGDSVIVFVGAGEEVQLTVGSESAVCNPVPSTDSPPWNWGDAGEGGGIKQDVGLIVSESIVGKWQSVDDAKFTREFKADGTAVDMYDGKDATSGTWKVFTKDNPITVAFPLVADKVYIQMTMQGTQGDTLNFSLNKLTPEEL